MPNFKLIETIESREFVDESKVVHKWSICKVNDKTATTYEGPKGEFIIPGEYRPNMVNFQESIDFITKMKLNNT
jgi:hypothetical protein